MAINARHIAQPPGLCWVEDEGAAVARIPFGSFDQSLQSRTLVSLSWRPAPPKDIATSPLEASAGRWLHDTKTSQL
jgi:hypothetical protein